MGELQKLQELSIISKLTEGMWNLYRSACNVEAKCHSATPHEMLQVARAHGAQWCPDLLLQR